MSSPTARVKPARRATSRTASTPPAGPDNTASGATNRDASTRLPSDRMASAPSGIRSRSRARASTGVMAACTRVVSRRESRPRSGATSWPNATKTSGACSRTHAARASSCSGARCPFRRTIATASNPTRTSGSGSTSGSISAPSVPIRPGIPSARSHSGGDRRTSGSKSSGRVMSPIQGRSSRPSSSRASVRTPVRSSNALVATVVPKRSLPVTSSPITASSDRTFRMDTVPSGSMRTTSVKVPPRSMRVRGSSFILPAYQAAARSRRLTQSSRPA